MAHRRTAESFLTWFLTWVAALALLASTLAMAAGGEVFAADDAGAPLPQANAVQKLISPAEMGELFKVLAVGHRVEWPERLLQHDRSYRL